MRHLLLIPVFLLLVSCEKEVEEIFPEEELSFPWVQEGNVLTYSYYSPEQTIDEALKLNVVKYDQDERGYKYLKFDFVRAKGYWGLPDASRDYNVFRKPGKLETDFSDCTLFSPFPSKPREKATRAPEIANIGTKYPFYRCENWLWNSFEVIKTDETVFVPAGEFNTYVMRNDSLNILEYWSAEHGIIQFEKISPRGEVDWRFVLRETNY